LTVDNHACCLVLVLTDTALLQKPGRQDVYFSGVAIYPKRSEDGKRWVAALQEHNPSMVHRRFLHPAVHTITQHELAQPWHRAKPQDVGVACPAVPAVPGDAFAGKLVRSV
jgi:hypothetical protein